MSSGSPKRIQPTKVQSIRHELKFPLEKWSSTVRNCKGVSHPREESDTIQKTRFSNYPFENIAETFLEQLCKFYSFIFTIWPVESSYVALPDLHMWHCAVFCKCILLFVVS